MALDILKSVFICL